MSTQFSDREKGLETGFKMEARRNKLFGLWLAEEPELRKTEHEAYAKDVVPVGHQEPGVEGITRKMKKVAATTPPLGPKPMYVKKQPNYARPLLANNRRIMLSSSMVKT